jgi:hypothetical protein
MLDVDSSTAFAAARNALCAAMARPVLKCAKSAILVLSDNAEYADDDEVSDGDGGGMLDED